MTTLDRPAPDRPALGRSPSGPAAPDRPRWFRPLLALDAVGCAAIGAVLFGAAGTLAAGLHLTSTGPVLLAGVLFLAAAAANGIGARTGRTWPTLVAIDLDAVFVLWMLLVLADGRGEPWARTLAAAGLVVAVAFGAAKAVGLRRRRG